MKLGYARISTKEQKLDLQLDALKKAGCEKIFSDVISEATKDRPNLNKMLEQVRAGDTVVVYKLDRLGRSLWHLVNLINFFMEKGVHFQSLSDNIDTNSPQGKLMFNIIASLAEFERDLIRERTKAGLEATRTWGKKEDVRKVYQKKPRTSLTPRNPSTNNANSAFKKSPTVSGLASRRCINI